MQKNLTPVSTLAMTLAKVDEVEPDKEYVDRLLNTATKIREFEIQEGIDSEEYEDLATLVSKYIEEADEVTLSAYEVEGAINLIFKMCETLTDPKEIMDHMRVARDLRYVWYAFHE